MWQEQNPFEIIVLQVSLAILFILLGTQKIIFNSDLKILVFCVAPPSMRRFKENYKD